MYDTVRILRHIFLQIFPISDMKNFISSTPPRKILQIIIYYIYLLTVRLLLQVQPGGVGGTTTRVRHLFF